MKNLSIILSIFFIGCSSYKSGMANNRLSSGPNISEKNIDDAVYASPTIYYISSYKYEESIRCEEGLKKEILTDKDIVLAKVCSVVYKSCEMQGTCRVGLQNGQFKVFNVLGIKNGVRRFKVIDEKECPYGYGRSSDGFVSYKKMCLDPFFSVAADLSKYRLGDVLFFPDLKNRVLPNGQIHDGFVTVRDSGGRIKGLGRFDFFTGYQHYANFKNPFAEIGLNDKKNRFKYEKLTHPQEIEQIQKAHRFPFAHYQ